MSVLPPQILREFLDQSSGLLDRVDQDIADIDRTGNASLGTGIASAFRSIRSGAAFLELADLEAAATRAESLLKEFKADSLEIARRELATLRKAVSTLRASTPAESASETPAFLPIPTLRNEPTSIPDPSDPDARALAAATHVEARTVHSPIESPLPSVCTDPDACSSRCVAAILEQMRTVIANVSARTGRDLHAEITGGQIEADLATCQALHSALPVIVAHTSNHTAASCDPALTTCPAAVIHITAESEGANVCIRIESPVSTLDSWASDPHLDAARTAIEGMLGSLTLTAEGPSATSVVLRIPAHPSTFPAMVVRAGDALCALPASQIEEIVFASVAGVTGEGAHRTAHIRGQSLPFLDAPRLFAHASHDSVGKHIVVLRAAGGRIALGVDRALGLHEVTLRDSREASTTTAANRGWAALPDESLALVVDVPVLVRSATAEPHLALAA
jgi:chemotaxis protein histidine kinase CheA